MTRQLRRDRVGLGLTSRTAFRDRIEQLIHHFGGIVNIVELSRPVLGPEEVQLYQLAAKLRRRRRWRHLVRKRLMPGCAPRVFWRRREFFHREGFDGVRSELRLAKEVLFCRRVFFLNRLILRDGRPETKVAHIASLRLRLGPRRRRAVARPLVAPVVTQRTHEPVEIVRHG